MGEAIFHDLATKKGVRNQVNLLFINIIPTLINKSQHKVAS